MRQSLIWTFYMLTFSYDVQHHSERGESSNHVEEGHCILDVQTLFSSPEIQTTDQQWHEKGLEAVDQQGDQVSEVIVHVTPDGEDGSEAVGLFKVLWHVVLCASPDEDRKLVQFTGQLVTFPRNSDEFLSTSAWLLDTAGHEDRKVTISSLFRFLKNNWVVRS